MDEHSAEPENGPDVLGDRLRSAFAAERSSVEAGWRQSQRPSQRPSQRSSRRQRWQPVGVVAAAAALVIAVLVFGGGQEPTTIDVGVSSQTDIGNWEAPQPVLPGPENRSPIGSPSPPDIVPVLAGENFCGDHFEPQYSVVWSALGGLVPLQDQPEATGTQFVQAQVPVGSTVTLVGGCTAGITSLGSMIWYEVEWPAAPQPLWINGQSLVAAAHYNAWRDEGIRPATAGDAWALESLVTPRVVKVPACGALPVVFPVRFVDAKSEGAVLTRGGPARESPEVRKLRPDEVVILTTQCERGADGTVWYELDAGGGLFDWIPEDNLLPVPGPGCRTENGAEIEGLVIPNGDPLAFVDFDPDSGEGLASQGMTYRWYPAAEIAHRQCYGSTTPGPVCLSGSIVLTDPEQPGPVWTGLGPVQAQATGFTHPGRSTDVDAVQVVLSEVDGSEYTGFVDPFETMLIEPGLCP